METVIKYNKVKPVTLLIISLAFTLICIWLIFDSNRNSITGFAGLTLFTILDVYIVYRLKKGGGIILNESGIVTDRNNPDDTFISWNEIERFSLYEANGIRTINIHLFNPGALIERQTKTNVRKNMQINQTLYNAPVGINPNLLDIKYKRLENLLMENLETYKKNNITQH
ncbi:MAG TPA: STM3941 family protein [Paludibacteraceae bacterium]|nr:STM3941 family protein [Paludibacteraceae bacterium]